jgi:hypothetical protein
MRQNESARGDSKAVPRGVSEANQIVRFALNNRWLEEQGVPDMNAPAAAAARKIPRSLTAWTQRSGVKAVRIVVALAALAPPGCLWQAVSLRSAHYGPACPP